MDGSRSSAAPAAGWLDGHAADRVVRDLGAALRVLGDGGWSGPPQAEGWLPAATALDGPDADTRALGRATAMRARLLGLVGPGRSGGSIG